MVKTDEEIELIRESSLLVSKTLAELANHIKPGVTPLFLDKLAEEFIRDHGAVPGFTGYQTRLKSRRMMCCQLIVVR
jgi:methionyl aminopeptidase